MKLARLFALIAVLGWPSLSLAANTAATVQKPVTAGNCAAYGTYPNVADSGVGCANNQVTISDGVHGSMLLAPSLFGIPNSAGILNTTSQQPLVLTKGVATTATDAVDFDFRRVANYSTGGTAGFVNTVGRFYTLVTADRPSFEWSLLAVMDNNQAGTQGSENVAAYVQSHKRFATAGTWALTAELQDHVANPTAPSVTFEHDLQVKGADTNGARVIDDLWVKSDDGNPATVTYGYRLNTDSHSTITNGISTYGATIGNAAIAVGSGQKVCFDGVTCSNYWSQSGGTMTIGAGGSTQSFNSLGANLGLVNALALTSTSGGISLPSGQKICLNTSATCTSYLWDNGGAVQLVGASSTSLGSVSVLSLFSSGNVDVASGQKLCLDGLTCSNYLTQSGGAITIAATGATNMGSVTALSIASSGNVDVAGGQKLCLDGLTCANYLTQSGGAITMAASGSGVTLPAASAPSLTSTGNIILSTNQKICLNGATCTIYLSFDGTSFIVNNGSQAKLAVDMTTGNGGVQANFKSGLSTGVTSCTGINAATVTVNGGIITHC